jgi:hypothetical protein
MEIWQWIVIGVAVVAVGPVVYALDRLGLWLEKRGLLYYRKRKPSSGAASCMVGMQQFIEPQVKHVLQIDEQKPAEEHNGAEPPSD